MAKKSTAQGIGYISNADALGELTRQLISFLNAASANTDNSLGEEFINKLKEYVDAYVGRSRTNFTKTDVYQALYLLLYSPIFRVTVDNNRVFKDTMVNTVVAKLVTEGQYGNPGVVRRQTTEDKILKMLMRTIGYEPSMLRNSNKLISRFGLNSSQDEFPILMRVARKFLQRGTRSTITTRRSNRTRRTTTPRSTTPSASTPTATVTEINVPGYTSEATPPAPVPPPPVDTLIRNMKITDEFDFGVEWEHFGLGLPKIKRAMEKIGQPFYPEYVPYHDFDSYDRAIKPGMFPNNKVNKGWWVLQIDGSVYRDRREPASEFKNTKQEAIIEQRGRRYDTYEGEFVSPVLGGKRGLAIIKLVGNTLVNIGMRHNKTMGMHTHVTKRGFTRSNIKNLMYNYVAMEPLIEAMMEPNRRSTSPSQYNRSHFIQLGLSLSSNESQVQSLLKQKILDISENQFYIDFGQIKQQAVNLKPFYGGNTIEFRQQGANFEADSVTMWIAFLFYFCQFSKKKRFTGFQWNNLIAIMPVGLASFWYNRIQDLTGKSPYELSFRK